MTDDNVIAVMGVTGAGKSSFVKLITGDSAIKIGHGMEATTVSISKHVRYIHGRQYTLVDTPGFNDTFRSDSEVLKQLVEWLYSTYTSGTKLRGILYIHRITEVRMQGSSLSNLKTFKQLCGESYFKCITLGTSCWSTVTETTGRNREIELQENSQFWKPLLSRGARYSRLPDDFSAACDLVTSMCGHDHNRTTKPQVIRELDAGTTFSNLSAIKTLESYELETQRKRHEEDMRRIKAEQEAKARAQEEGRRLRLEIAQWEQQNRMIEHHLSLRNRCSGNKPHGKCDRCGSRLWQWAVVFHCCSCYSADNYWQCGPCGWNCGKDLHPRMTRIDNDNCVVM